MGIAEIPTEENYEPTSRQTDFATASPRQYISHRHSPIEGAIQFIGAFSHESNAEHVSQ